MNERLTRRDSDSKVEIIEVDEYDWLDEDDWARIAYTLAEKLAAYEDAEEQERLVMLLSSAGSTVYLIEKQYQYTGTKTNYWEDWEGNHKQVEDRITEVTFKLRIEAGIHKITLDDFGKTVFLTREQAEKALMEGGGK